MACFGGVRGDGHPRSFCRGPEAHALVETDRTDRPTARARMSDVVRRPSYYFVALDNETLQHLLLHRAME